MSEDVPPSSSDERFPVEPAAPAVLAVDVGGSHVKVMVNGTAERRRFDSGPELTPAQMVEQVLALITDWRFECVSIGVPAPVVRGRVVREPVNLGTGWTDFDFGVAFGRPTKLINDAAMQALGSYDGGRMLFLGLGTGLGTTMILDGTIEAMEIGHLPFRDATYEDFLGAQGRESDGKKRWRTTTFEVIDLFLEALHPDYVVVGGGNAKDLGELPPHCRLGSNRAAFLGGFRLWIDDTIGDEESLTDRGS